MENTSRTSSHALTGRKVIQTAMLIVFAGLICRTPLTGEFFPAATAVTAYMVSRKPQNLYLMIPIAAGILPYYTRGYDIWCDLISMSICGLFFAAAHRIGFRIWHIALTAAAINIICTCIYRMATLTIYKTDVQTLVFEGFLVFAMVFLTDGFCHSLTEKHDTSAPEIPTAAFAAVCLLIVCGAGLSFLLWPAAVFVSLWAAAYQPAGQALYTAVAAGITAALAGQPQWGFLMTIVIGLCAASLCKRHGMLLTGIVFVMTCAALRSVESGVVLGIDNYCLFLGTAGFLAINWKFGKGMRKVMELFAGNREHKEDSRDSKLCMLLQERESEMNDLSQLYSTYLDKRSVLAGQFDITAQIMEAVRRSHRGKVRHTSEKFDVEIAVSQCAAAGSINGDCCGWNEIGDDRVAMVLSDGMGKGKKAAAESLMVVKTIMALLRCGVSTELTLKMVNTIMMIKDDEDSFATVDLIIVDKRTGHARFYKIGAAPTLVRHKDAVEEVRLSAVPLGIVNGLKIRYVDMTVRRGDWIIMMSDGITDGGDGKGIMTRIRDTAAGIRSSDPQLMCDLILDQAADSYIGRERDDMTVMSARIV
ncbi:MAG: SpoIIE family protein phosphatase [Lentihominibacter sp.]